MSILSIAVGRTGKHNTNTIFTISYYLREYYFFEKKGMREICIFATRVGLKNNSNTGFMRIPYDDYMCYVLSGYKDLGVVCFVDNRKEEFPEKVIKRLLHKIQNNFILQYGTDWQDKKTDYSCHLKELENFIVQCQTPEKIDAILKLNSKLEETKNKLIDTINSCYIRQQKIEELLVKSVDISNASKRFYKQSKKMNRCCNIM